MIAGSLAFAAINHWKACFYGLGSHLGECDTGGGNLQNRKMVAQLTVVNQRKPGQLFHFIAVFFVKCPSP